MHERLKSPHAKRMKVQRSSTVEPVLGTLINFTGMRRIWTRGRVKMWHIFEPDCAKQRKQVCIRLSNCIQFEDWINWQEINKKLTRNKPEAVENPAKSKLSACDDLIKTFRTHENSQLIFLN